jgi:hypothetical protein
VVSGRAAAMSLVPQAAMVIDCQTIELWLASDLKIFQR